MIPLNVSSWTYGKFEGSGVPYEAAGALDSGIFVRINLDGEVEEAELSATDSVGVIYGGATARYEPVFVINSGKSPVVADTELVNRHLVKVGPDGCATAYQSSENDIQTAAIGVATSFTGRAASVITIAQAGDVAADRGRGIVLVGTNAAGDEIIETVTLNALNSTTGVASTLTFATLAGAYTADGAVLGAQNVTLTATAGLRATLLAAASHIGAVIPAQNAEAYGNSVHFYSAAQDNTFITLVGYKAATPDTLTAERIQLDNNNPSLAESSDEYRQITRICLGELTNGRSVRIYTEADDPASLMGRLVEGATRGATAIIQL